MAKKIETVGQEGLAQLVQQAPEPVWRRIAKLLRVDNRKAALRVIADDFEAGSAVAEILKVKLAEDEDATALPEISTPRPSAPMPRRRRGLQIA